MTGEDMPPPLVRENARRYRLGDYEIVRTGHRRWTLGRYDPEHVTTFGGGRDRGYHEIQAYPTLTEAAEEARADWRHSRDPRTIAETQAMMGRAPKGIHFPARPRCS